MTELMVAIGRAIKRYLLLFIEGDQVWGTLRLIGALCLMGAFVLLGRLLEFVPHITFVDDYTASLGLPTPLAALAQLLASIFTPQVLRHVLGPFFGFLLALFVGARYVRDLLELPHLGQAFDHLLFTLFGGDYPRMTIADGRASVADPERNPMLKIGGPGYVEIKLGSAAIFERGVGPTAVRGAGEHFLRRFETLREGYDLRELERTKAGVPVQTRDGVPLVLDEVRVRFRLRTRGARSAADPYPVLASAIRQATYSRRVTDKGFESWSDIVLGLTVGTITGWLSRRRMDDLFPPPLLEGADLDDNTWRRFLEAPTEELHLPAPLPSTSVQSPIMSAGPFYRSEVHNLFLQKTARDKFADIGAEIIWVAIGHLRPDSTLDPRTIEADSASENNTIRKQMIDTWKAHYQSFIDDEIIQAHGYAEWLIETAKAQVQAQMIETLTQGIREVQAAGVSVADVIAARGVDFIASLSAHTETTIPTLPEPVASTDRLNALLKKLSETAGQPPETKSES